MKRKIHGIVAGSGPVPRHGNKIFGDKKEAGYVTSGCLSPVRNDKIALCYLPDTAEFDTGVSLEIEIHNKRFPAEIVETPFYKKGH